MKTKNISLNSILHEQEFINFLGKNHQKLLSLIPKIEANNIKFFLIRKKFENHFEYINIHNLKDYYNDNSKYEIVHVIYQTFEPSILNVDSKIIYKFTYQEDEDENTFCATSTNYLDNYLRFMAFYIQIICKNVFLNYNLRGVFYHVTEEQHSICEDLESMGIAFNVDTPYKAINLK